jgi:hypothetical protein
LPNLVGTPTAPFQGLNVAGDKSVIERINDKDIREDFMRARPTFAAVVAACVAAFVVAPA